MPRGLLSAYAAAYEAEVRRFLAAGVVVALPDPAVVERVVRAVRSQTDRASIIVRSRYHKHAGSLEPAGASVIVDEEQEVGKLLGERAASLLRPHSGTDDRG